MISEIFPSESPFLMSVMLINKATNATWDYLLSKIKPDIKAGENRFYSVTTDRGKSLTPFWFA